MPQLSWGRHRGHERRDEPAEHQATPAGREMVSDDHGVAGLAVGNVGVEHQRRQAGQDPRPGSHAVVRQGEPERGQHRVPFVARRHHPLGQIATAARLLPRVPAGPPLHTEIGDERRHRERQGRSARCVRATEGRQKTERRLRKLVGEPGHAADLRDTEREDGDRERAGHRQTELDQIGQDDTPEPGQRDIAAGQRQPDKDGGQSVPAEGHAEDLGHRQVDPADDEAVDRQAEIEGATPAEQRGRPATVAELHERDVGQDAGAAPEPREEEHAEHAAEGGAPPDPVPGDAVGGDDAGHRQRCVGGERGRHHRRAGQPPGQLAPGQEILPEALTGATRGAGSHDERKEETAGENEPVERRERHY